MNAAYVHLTASEVEDDGPAIEDSLALLARWAEAEANAPRGNIRSDIEPASWRAAERLLTDAYNSYKRLAHDYVDLVLTKPRGAK